MEILDSLNRHSKNERASFHMPGHKNGAAFLGTQFENSLLSFDVTEVPGTDCLANPKEAIAQSQQKAAKLFGAARAFYLVNGSTCGILSMFYAFFREGDTVIVDRSCHKSVINALTLCNLKPVFIAPNQDFTRGIPTGITANKVKETIKKYPEAKGIFITSPNYYGMLSEVRHIADIAHENGICLLVDEAHGAHFPFDSRLPESAMSQGADAAVVSLHKSLPCPNQTAVLLLKNADMAENIQGAINTFQTTSPSYMLLLYIEAALSLASSNGRSLTDKLLSFLEPFGKYRTDDPFKLLLSCTDNGLSGYEAERILRENFGIYAELCDRKNVLLMCSWGNREEDFKLLKEAVSTLNSMKTDKPYENTSFDIEFAEGKPALTPHEVKNLQTEWVDISASLGRISAESITAFPPCIPVLLPGEKIEKAQLDAVRCLIERDAADGVRDGKICVVH